MDAAATILHSTSAVIGIGILIAVITDAIIRFHRRRQRRPGHVAEDDT